jgi:outer membrane protein, multidrug efflux system
MKKNLNIIILGLAALSLSSCKTLYGKYERPDVKTSGIVRDVASDTDTLAVKDTTTFANIPWRSVFTDPQLQSIIEKGLNNNVNLLNAALNVKIAEESRNHEDLTDSTNQHTTYGGSTQGLVTILTYT